MSPPSQLHTLIHVMPECRHSVHGIQLTFVLLELRAKGGDFSAGINL